jgi:hypothetical protein
MMHVGFSVCLVLFSVLPSTLRSSPARPLQQDCRRLRNQLSPFAKSAMMPVERASLKLRQDLGVLSSMQ